MTHEYKHMVEYGSEEFDSHRSIYTVIEKSTYVNPHGLVFPCELYHRTEGYKPAGSCAIYTPEVWGYSIRWNDGTTTGRNSTNAVDIKERWDKIRVH